MADIDTLPELHEGHQGHIEAHNTIREILRDHHARLRALGVRISHLEFRPWLPEDPGNPARQQPEGPRQNPELPEQPPKRHNPELPEQTPIPQPQGR